MFGIGFLEFIVIAVVAIIFLGPDKLPEAAVKVVKAFRTFSKSVNDAKNAIQEEINLQELKDDSKKYRALLEKNTQQIKNVLSFEELETLRDGAKDVNSAIEELKTQNTDDKTFEQIKNDAEQADENAALSLKDKETK